MLARPVASSVLTCARASVRPALPRPATRAAVRFNSSASAPSPAPAQKGGAAPYVLGALALGAGYWYYAQESEPVPDALNSDEFRDFVVKATKPYNHDSHLVSFALPKGAKAGTFTASAVVFKAVDGLKDDKGREVIRPYTPVSSPDAVGELDFLIKEYPNGNMSKHVGALKPGDKLAIKGPIPKWKYEANQFEEIALLAGGSGITPMWQLIDTIASHPADKTKVTLVYTNKTESDILLREKFDALAKSNPDQFKIVYGLDQAPANWQGFQGYLTTDIAKSLLPDPTRAEKVHVFVCGPPPQMKALSGPKGKNFTQGELSGVLKELGYTSEQVYKF